MPPAHFATTMRSTYRSAYGRASGNPPIRARPEISTAGLSYLEAIAGARTVRSDATGHPARAPSVWRYLAHRSTDSICFLLSRTTDHNGGFRNKSRTCTSRAAHFARLGHLVLGLRARNHELDADSKAVTDLLRGRPTATSLHARRQRERLLSNPSAGRRYLL